MKKTLAFSVGTLLMSLMFMGAGISGDSHNLPSCEITGASEIHIEYAASGECSISDTIYGSRALSSCWGSDSKCRERVITGLCDVILEL